MPLSGTLISEAKRSEEIVSCGDEIVGLRGWGDAGEESARSTYHSAAESRLTAPGSLCSLFHQGLKTEDLQTTYVQPDENFQTFIFFRILKALY